MTLPSEVGATKNEVTHGKFYTNVHCDGTFYFFRRMLLCNMIKGNARFVQKVIFEPSIDLKKTLWKLEILQRMLLLKVFLT